MPGVDYDSMLSELGKFGASFILATQSLAKLDELSPVLRHSILANVGCLAVFQVASSDARLLVDELGANRVSIDDITGLPVHHCYVRATVDTERLPAFSMAVRRPERGDLGVARRIRDGTVEYTTSLATLEARDASHDDLATEVRRRAVGAESVSTPSGSGSSPAPPTDARIENNAPHRKRRNGNVNGSDGARGGKTTSKRTP